MKTKSTRDEDEKQFHRFFSFVCFVDQTTQYLYKVSEFCLFVVVLLCNFILSSATYLHICCLYK